MICDNRKRYGRRTRVVRGVRCSELREVFSARGLKCRDLSWYCSGDKPTLAKWLKIYSNKRRGERPYVLIISDHFIVVRGRKIYDNHNPKGVWLRQFKGRRKRVAQFWWVDSGLIEG